MPKICLPLRPLLFVRPVNGAEVLQYVRLKTGVSLSEISGDQEAAITYFAVRRWQGWGAGAHPEF